MSLFWHRSEGIENVVSAVSVHLTLDPYTLITSATTTTATVCLESLSASYVFGLKTKKFLREVIQKLGIFSIFTVYTLQFNIYKKIRIKTQ